MSLVQVGEELGDGVQITINPSAKRIKLEEPEGDQQSVKVKVKFKELILYLFKRI